MSVYRRGDSFWYEFVVLGVRYRGSIGRVTKGIAREVAEKKRIEALEGKLVERPVKAPLFGHYNPEKKEFTDAAGKYLDYYRANHKPHSVHRILSSLGLLSRVFSNKRLDEIKPFQIEQYKQERKGKNKADATVNRELACLKNLFNMAIRWGWVRENPVCKVRLFRENNARQRFLTPEEERELVKCCYELGNLHLASLVIAAVDTGFRAGELESLCWKDVDFESKEIGVASAYTKNGEPRRNPMTQRLTEMLALLKGTGKVDPQAAVFGPYRYHKAFWKARDAAKLGKDVCFHTLRHTFVSRLMMKGVDIRTVQELAGHKEIKMTMRYAHLAPEQKRRAIGLLESEVPTKIPTAFLDAVASLCAPVAQPDRAEVF